MVLIFLISMPSFAEWRGESRAMLGTEISVYLWHEDAARAKQLIEAVFTETSRIDDLMSTYKEDSRISEVNRRAAEEPVEAGSELFQLVQRAHDISVLTRGAFDITYDSVGQLYDYREGRKPEVADIEKGLAAIDYRLVELDPKTSSIRFARPGVRQQVWERFTPALMSKLRGDQDWLAHVCPNEVTWPRVWFAGVQPFPDGLPPCAKVILCNDVENHVAAERWPWVKAAWT